MSPPPPPAAIGTDFLHIVWHSLDASEKPFAFLRSRVRRSCKPARSDDLFRSGRQFSRSTGTRPIQVTYFTDVSTAWRNDSADELADKSRYRSSDSQYTTLPICSITVRCCRARRERSRTCVDRADPFQGVGRVRAAEAQCNPAVRLIGVVCRVAQLARNPLDRRRTVVSKQREMHVLRHGHESDAGLFGNFRRSGSGRIDAPCLGNRRTESFASARRARDGNDRQIPDFLNPGSAELLRIAAEQRFGNELEFRHAVFSLPDRRNAARRFRPRRCRRGPGLPP